MWFLQSCIHRHGVEIAINKHEKTWEWRTGGIAKTYQYRFYPWVKADFVSVAWVLQWNKENSDPSTEKWHLININTFLNLNFWTWLPGTTPKGFPPREPYLSSSGLLSISKKPLDEGCWMGKTSRNKVNKGRGRFCTANNEHGIFCTKVLLCLLPTSMSAEEFFHCEVAEIGNDKKFFFSSTL